MNQQKKKRKKKTKQGKDGAGAKKDVDIHPARSRLFMIKKADLIECLVTKS